MCCEQTKVASSHALVITSGCQLLAVAKQLQRLDGYVQCTGGGLLQVAHGLIVADADVTHAWWPVRGTPVLWDGHSKKTMQLYVCNLSGTHAFKGAWLIALDLPHTDIYADAQLVVVTTIRRCV